MTKLLLLLLLMALPLPAAPVAAPQTPAPAVPAVAGQNSVPVQKQIKALNMALAKAQKAATDLSTRVDADRTRLADSLSRLSALVSRLGHEQDSVGSRLAEALSVDSSSRAAIERVRSMEKTARRLLVALLFVILLLFIVVIVLLRKLRQTQPLPDMIHSEVQYFFNKLKGILNRQPGGFTPEIDDTRIITRDVKEADHTLPVRVAEEVFRMRTRLSRMPADTKGMAALSNAVKRLEDDLNVKGYFIVDLTDQPYVDEMTIAVREFVPRDDLPAGEKKILRMIRPQVKFKNVIISQGEVEVSMSTEDLAQH